MITSWSLRLLAAIAGILLIASTTPADADILTRDAQLDGPIIFPSGNDITLQTGQNFTLRCRGKKPVQFKQQESPEGVTGLFYMEPGKTTVNDSEYEVELNLYNVDRFAVGYYACFDNTVDSGDVLANLIEEPNNTAHISYIYIYVNDSNMFAPMRAFVLAKSNSKFIIECRPTTPDIKVKLTVDFADVEYERYNPKIGFTLDSDVLPDATSIFSCDFVRHGNVVYKDVIVYKHTIHPPPLPVISGGSQYFLEGETFSINCTVETQRNSPVELSWTIPGDFRKVMNTSNAYAVRAENNILYNNYTIIGASKEEAGAYVCTSKNSHENKSVIFTKQYLSKPLINMSKLNKGNPIEVTKQNLLRLRVNIIEYPPTDIIVLRDNNYLPADSKVNTTVQHNLTDGTAKCSITIRPISVEDTGNYTVVASNAYITDNVTFDIRVPGRPKVNFQTKTDKRYLQGTTASLVCDVTGYPLPEINWLFSHDTGEQLISKTKQRDTVKSLYEISSLLEIPVNLPGNITCEATNEIGTDSVPLNFLVYEWPDGFGIKNSDRTWFSENDKVVLTCLASKYDFTNVTWYGADYEEMENGVTLEHFNSSLSYIARLEIDRISVDQAGGYMCIGLRNNGSEENETIMITVAATQPLFIWDPTNENEEVLPYHAVNFTCTASAVPPPQINWYKDDERLLEDVNVEITTDTSDIIRDPKTRRSTVKILQMQEEYMGKYECRVNSLESYASKFYNVIIKERPSHKVTYLSVIGVIFFVLILLVVYLAWKIRKEKQFRKELAAAGLLNFKEGVTKSINPDLGIDEQAELLPYDEKFEFPAEKLILGKQLGAGAFGVVYKADARGIINAEETTTVAVKMVKKTADNMYIKALASELKIMVHLGKHVNIVNLLGACTKHVGKRELIVIVEYCKYGNIHNYMQKHREVFIDQLTDNPEKNLGKINRGYSCSSGNSGMHSDYFGSNHTQDTDHTFLNTANTNRSVRKDNAKQVEFVKVSESGYVQPEWRSNYESDYSFDGRSPRPLCSRDLLAWAFQIARGMEYLASRKVLHGDLAARNVLLADDNVVKICDFGLARSIYKNDEYQKKENSPLPVKWLAIECMTDRIFSTQSDVWSFGIVLWELFSLAKTPYPNVSPPSLLHWLNEGHRLSKPTYADDKLYDVMMRCWLQKPNDRPSFSQLQQILGSFLEDNVRNHYVDLNATYMDMNIKREGEDYLAMVNAPDYNNMVTPSPHHYVNDARSFRNFFPQTPTQLEHDDEGYLQMSPATRQTIFNARAQGTNFDFDSRKLAPRVCEPNSYGSELTPMLTLSNLPRSGSESDHEGNSSPYLNMCPRIEEETDDVFETKQNNVKNIQPSAVTNPTYITFSTDDEKKAQNYANNYINVNVPNGLVK